MKEKREGGMRREEMEGWRNRGEGIRGAWKERGWSEGEREAKDVKEWRFWEGEVG